MQLWKGWSCRESVSQHDLAACQSLQVNAFCLLKTAESVVELWHAELALFTSMFLEGCVGLGTSLGLPGSPGAFFSMTPCKIWL